MNSRRFFRAFPLWAALLAAPSAFADKVSDLVDLSTMQWRPLPPVTARMVRHSGNVPLRLTVHFTDEPKNPDKSLKEKLRTLYHYSLYAVEGTKKRLWGDIPYHYYIAEDGKLGECRDPSFMADSNTAYQRDGHITVVVEGNTDDGITPAQKRKLFALLQALQEKYWIPTSRVGTHKDYAQTDCPGDEIAAAVQEYKRSRGGLK